MKCGVCGSNMHVRTYGTVEKRRNAYRCGKYHSVNRTKVGFVTPECSKTQHNADTVDRAVWAEVERVLRDPALLREAAGLSDTTPEARHEDEIAGIERELAGLARRTQNLLRIGSKGLADESDIEKQLAEVQAQRRSLEAQREAVVGRREAATAMKGLALDFGDRLAAITARLDDATFEQRRALVEALFPKRGSFGVRIFPDGRIEAEGLLAMPANGDVELNAGSAGKLTSARRSPGCSSRPPRR